VRRIALFLVLGVAATALSACNWNSPAATVNGTQISESSFQNQLTEMSQSSDVRCALELLSNHSIPAQGAATSTVPTEEADAELTQLIQIDLYKNELARLHAPVNATFLGYAKTDLPDDLSATTGSSPCGLSGQTLVAGLPSWFVNQEVTELADEERLVSVVGHVDLGTTGVEKFYADNPDDWHYLCLDALGTTTQAEAESDYNKIKGGTSFSTVAQASSDNANLAQYGFTTNGAYEECEPLEYIGSDQSNWAGALDQVNLATGVVAPPFDDSAEVDNGGTNDWVVLEITKKETEPLSTSLSNEIRDYLIHENLQTLVNEQSKLFKNASVTVNPQFGSWKSNKEGILSEVAPPSAPKPAYTLDAGADGSSS
jgi:hypothetical protein